jgi:hypothetical protein
MFAMSAELLHVRIALLASLLEEAAAALPDAWFAHANGVPRELVERIERTVSAERFHADRWFEHRHAIPRELIDALCAADGKPAGVHPSPEQLLPEEWSRVVVLPVTTADVLEHADIPSWAAFTITPAWLRQLRAHQRLCQLAKLEHVAIIDQVDEWGGREDSTEDLRTENDLLLIDSRGFKLTAETRDAGLPLETVWWDIEQFVATLLATPEDESVAMPGYTDCLELYLDQKADMSVAIAIDESSDEHPTTTTDTAT